jgi:hypothetical protein
LILAIFLLQIKWVYGSVSSRLSYDYRVDVEESICIERIAHFGLSTDRNTHVKSTTYNFFDLILFGQFMQEAFLVLEQFGTQGTQFRNFDTSHDYSPKKFDFGLSFADLILVFIFEYPALKINLLVAVL